MMEKNRTLSARNALRGVPRATRISAAPPRGRHGRSRLILLAMLGLGIGGCGGSEEIQQPTPLYGEEVPYPLALWDEGVEGETLLRVRVTDTGVVDSVEVAETSGHIGLDSAAVKGALDLRFQPGRRDGERIRMWATLPVVFSRRPTAEEFD